MLLTLIFFLLFSGYWNHWIRVRNGVQHGLLLAFVGFVSGTYWVGDGLLGKSYGTYISTLSSFSCILYHEVKYTIELHHIKTLQHSHVEISTSCIRVRYLTGYIAMYLIIFLRPFILLFRLVWLKPITQYWSLWAMQYSHVSLSEYC